ncbi:MetQ/NlpA family ABC transporter substrate-binding protein [Campylobacter hepaticus]|uniref:MetQ/NlpA family ABC transporter substrate-binding protein n=1 Tax=Campylobacter hepaticus TaxID=1813019 RepID=A0A6A7JR83_9BACT|nr:MetQ/NlpA family ABC transporter substrate-binding protein [Campylobacter hepaticus]AXP08672.1 MetQ/NlpA family ABC transporter substrate-binding protein [Campylobacter hepaticus]MCZ0772516.1 MetQ/NlpA family ABC transporter substrate-binding protein [Campylobacter hepaticus]MCZ0773984.1 MetQ/NlpA family ABC transporter substrate-binding protein [Campylobacter hepaticus]MCZ0775236.1 MetQ/NlpA family ABC transporter substrate-binding protein [Campylobacter hepaticus]MPV53776.1 methionine ABC
MKLYKIILFICILNLSNLLAASITIGVTPNPFANLLELMKNDFQNKGYELKIIEFSDYILPNRALEEKELDANLYQHKSFLEAYNAKRNANLIATTPVIIAPIGIYSKKIKNLQDLKKGSKVAIPNDATNENRALELLEKAGLINLNQNSLKTLLDINKNPKNLKFIELKAAQLPRSLDDVDIAIINSNYALDAGLNPSKDTLFREDKNSPYVNYVVVRSEDKNSIKTQIIDEILRSDKFKAIIDKYYKDILIPAF